MAALLAAALAWSAPARAASSWTVDTTADDASGNPALCVSGHCPTLRDAVAKANSESGDTIVLPASSQSYQVTNGDLQLSSDMQIQGASASSVTIDAAGKNRVFELATGTPSVTISGVTLTGGNSGGTTNPGAGGAIYVGAGILNLDNSVVTGNTASTSGGGIDANATLNVNGSTISNNKTTGGFGIGGGIDCFCTQVTVAGSTISGNTASGGSGNQGGGIQYSSGSPLILTGSTVNGNSAAAGGGGLYLSSGGANLTNDTIASNTGAASGGGIDQETDGLNLMNVTLAQNSSPGGANYHNGDFSGTVQNTIFANPQGGGTDCDNVGVQLTSQGGNLQDENPSSGSNLCWDSTTTQATDQTGPSPNLAPLADNGGPTQTMALQSGSAAIDKGVASGAPSTDQRGGPRPQPPGGAYDVGAYEVGAVADVGISKSASPNPATVGQTLTYTLTVNNTGVSPDPAYNVTVTDSLPSGVTFQSASASQGSCSQSSGTVTCNLGTVAHGSSPTVTIKVTPNSAGTITNTARVSSSAKDPNGANDSASTSTQAQVAAASASKPVAATGGTSGNTGNAITLHGSVNPEGSSTSYYFQYGTSTRYGSATTSLNVGSGTSSRSVTRRVTGLAQGALYHYRIVAKNAAGPTYGRDRTFRTSTHPSIHVSPNRVSAGESVRLFGNAGGCPRGDRVTLMSRAFSTAHEFAGVPAVYATVGRGGAYSTITQIPASTSPGRYTVTGRCGGGNLGVSATLAVTARVAPRFTG